MNVRALGNFNKLKEVERLGLLINKNKTKYMSTKKKVKQWSSYKTILSLNNLILLST